MCPDSRNGRKGDGPPTIRYMIRKIASLMSRDGSSLIFPAGAQASGIDPKRPLRIEIASAEACDEEFILIGRIGLQSGEAGAVARRDRIRWSRAGDPTAHDDGREGLFRIVERGEARLSTVSESLALPGEPYGGRT